MRKFGGAGNWLFHFLCETLETVEHVIITSTEISSLTSQEYRPRMEVVAVGLDYDNQTATMRVSVFVGIPTMNSSRNSQITEKPVLTENFTSYEIYLTALQESDLWEPPSSCLTDPFLQHSRREVVVDCPLSGGRNTSEHPTTTPNPLSPSWETSCVDPNAVR